MHFFGHMVSSRQMIAYHIREKYGSEYIQIRDAKSYLCGHWSGHCPPIFTPEHPERTMPMLYGRNVGFKSYGKHSDTLDVALKLVYTRQRLTKATTP